MTKYIERDKAVKLIFLAADTGRAANALSLLGKESVADVAPVVHARWEAQEVGPIDAYKCSNCGLITINRNIPLLRYCERCGAKMDGGENK